jgi:hypothetical protein
MSISKASPRARRTDTLPGRARIAAGLTLLVALVALAATGCDRATNPSAAGGGRSAGTAPAAPSPAPGATAAAAPRASTAAAGGWSPGAPGVPIAGQPPTNELQPRSQSVRVSEASPPPPAAAAAPDMARAERELAARERRLAQRQAALDARERRLHRHEQSRSAATATDTAAAGGPEPPAASAAAGGAIPPAGAGGGSGAAATAGGAAAEGAAGMPGGAPAPAAGQEAPEPAVPVTLPAGTRFDVEFTKGLASNTSAVGETFRARIVSDLRAEGAIAIPAGSEVLGVVADAVGAGRIGAKAKLTVKFTDLVLPSGATLPVHASFLEEGKSRAGRDAATIGGSAAGGALLGRILSNGGGSRGTILGAIIGAAVGTAIASKTAGEEVVIPEGSVVSLKLDEPLEVPGG